MYESAEVASRETQFGIRVNGKVEPVAMGPAEAERYRAAGADVHRREITRYYPDTTEWREMPAPATTPPAVATEGDGGDLPEWDQHECPSDCDGECFEVER